MVVVVPCGARKELNPLRVTVFKSVVTRVGKVLIPEVLTSPETFKLVTLILGLPERPCATVAIPATPAYVAVSALPVKFPVTLPTTLPVRGPTKLEAVMIPDALILPDVLNPTPIPLFGFPPICRGLAGSVVPIPTLPST